MEQELINVFVSHYHNDEEHIGKMKELLGDKYSIRNYSVSSDKYNNAQSEDYIKQLLFIVVPVLEELGLFFVCIIYIMKLCHKFIKKI